MDEMDYPLIVIIDQWTPLSQSQRKVLINKNKQFEQLYCYL